MNEKLLARVAELYDLPGVKFHDNVAEGFLSVNYILIHNQTKYFLKQYPNLAEERVAEVHETGLFFNQHHIPVILPLKKKDHKTSFDFEGTQYALFPFREGLKIARADLSRTMFENLGKMLAKIHLLSKNSYTTKMKVRKFSRTRFFEKLEYVLPYIEKEKESDFGKLAYQSVMQKKNILENNAVKEESIALPYDHIIHGDYHDSNIFFDANGNIIHTFDLDKTEIAPRAFELVRSMDYMCFGGVFEENNFKKARTYLSAYRSIYPIEEDELRRGILTFFFKKAGSMWIENTHYLDKSTRVDIFLEKEFKTLLYLKDNLESFIEKLR